MKYVYPSMIVLSLIVNVIVVLIISRKFKYTVDDLVSMLVMENIGIIGGGILYTYIFSKELGFSSLGGVIGGLIMLYLYSLLVKKDYKYMLILFMPSIPLMYAIGKIGCFVAGCCYGIPYDGIGHIVYHSSEVALLNTNLFPIQIVETIIFLIIFVYIISRYYKNKFSIKLIMIEIIVCGIAKFLLDFLRYEHTVKLITSNQIMCLLLVIFSSIYLIRLNKKIKG
ncbi:MAG: prolipoprotein diacylglyceryl transferase [Firmicutes bacterium]|nr:prolipoprotein diacylglyceryl transferase [Bacillota bacterium]